MSKPTIAGKPQPFSASNALAAIGRAIAEIKSEDRLTWADVGAVLGVSDDQAAKYADGTATMSVVTYGRGKKEWNGRFTGYFTRLCEENRAIQCDDRKGHSKIIEAVLALSVALEDGIITPEEVRQNRATLEAARDAINDQLAKLRLSA